MARNKGGASLRKGIMVAVAVERGAVPTSEASLASCKSRSHMSKASSWSHSYNSLLRKSRSPATSLSIATALSDATSLPWLPWHTYRPTACALNELDASTNGIYAI